MHPVLPADFNSAGPADHNAVMAGNAPKRIIPVVASAFIIRIQHQQLYRARFNASATAVTFFIIHQNFRKGRLPGQDHIFDGIKHY
jgi:hypothetical protein